MKLTLSLVALAACCAGAGAHIHSQKVYHIDRYEVSLETWLLALSSSVLVAACGVFPVFLNRWVRLDEQRAQALPLRAVLSFAVGGLLGDVFLHLLPEAWGSPAGEKADWVTGLWVIAGVVAFLTVEKVANCTKRAAKETSVHAVTGDETQGGQQAGSTITNGAPKKTTADNGHCRNRHAQSTPPSPPPSLPSLTSPCSPHPPPQTAQQASRWQGKDISGYLNLAANCTDNFTHGLAIASSYVASPAVGMLTTLAILCHEVPHEIGDFAILLNSGFDVSTAAKAQLATACGGVVGVVAGLTAEHFTSSASWLLPFTAGGFLYIALVSILPQLLETHGWRDTVVQLGMLGVGIAVMAAVTIVERESCGHMPPHLLSLT